MMQMQRPVTEWPVGGQPMRPGVPNALFPAYSGDPAKKCYFEHCPRVGKYFCTWKNNCCRRGDGAKPGGCERLYCFAHKHEFSTTNKTKYGETTTVHRSCVNCKDKYLVDLKKNRRCCCYIAIVSLSTWFVGFLLFVMALQGYIWNAISKSKSVTIIQGKTNLLSLQ